MTWSRFLPVLLTGIAGLVLGSCSASRELPEGQVMLNKIIVVADGKYQDVNPSALKNYVRQKGNSRWFSTMKIPLGVYAMAGEDSSKWINKTLRNIGEAPVIFDTIQARQSCESLQRVLQNIGYLDSHVELFTEQKGKKLDAIYVLHPGQPYYIRRVSYDIQDSLIAKLLTNDMFQLKEGVKLNIDALNEERRRITERLQNSGYYKFHKEFISFRVDTVQSTHKADVTLLLRPYRATDILDTLHTRFTIRSLDFASGDPKDSVIHLRKSVLFENTFIKEGSLYSADDLQNTYNHFGRLGAVRYTNISFDQDPDSALLDAHIQLQTNKPSTLSFQPEGTNTAGDFGAAASLTYENRNLFRGAESFRVQLRGAYEAIRGLEGYSNQDYIEYSIESRLSFPRFIMPFINSETRRKTIATSEVSLTFDTQNRPEFHRRVLSAGWRYKWWHQKSKNQYQFDLLNLNYVFMPWISDTFKHEYLDNKSNYNAILSYNYEDLFIMKSGFGYSYNDGKTAIKTNFETAGNLLSLGSAIFGGNKDELDQYKVFNIA
jgi:outer membrane protein assembly factor BamA